MGQLKSAAKGKVHPLALFEFQWTLHHGCKSIFTRHIQPWLHEGSWPLQYIYLVTSTASQLSLFTRTTEACRSAPFVYDKLRGLHGAGLATIPMLLYYSFLTFVVHCPTSSLMRSTNASQCDEHLASHRGPPRHNIVSSTKPLYVFLNKETAVPCKCPSVERRCWYIHSQTHCKTLS